MGSSAARPFERQPTNVFDRHPVASLIDDYHDIFEFQSRFQNGATLVNRQRHEQPSGASADVAAADGRRQEPRRIGEPVSQ
jgi:hypothetical protein